MVQKETNVGVFLSDFFVLHSIHQKSRKWSIETDLETSKWNRVKCSAEFSKYQIEVIYCDLVRGCIRYEACG